MKRRHESGVEITPEISLGDSEILVTPKNQQKAKKRKKQNKIESKKNLKKVEIIQEPESNKNLKKIIDGLSDRLNEMTEIVQKLKETSDLLEKEKETPKKKVVECCFESEDAFRNHQKTVFVEGFRCSPPRGDIKSALIKHFSPCGEALTLDGSYLDGLRLTVKMAIKREEYYVFTNHNGCERCGIALFHAHQETEMTCVPVTRCP
ncbi:Uncharacterized protein Rs2_50374 [Raphanus sativus]|nr:Uncharacterized protein Rs2_50374 [Raphanus sativus]